MSGTLPPIWWVLAGAIVFATGRWLQLLQRRHARRADLAAARQQGEGVLATLREMGGRDGALPGELPIDLTAAAGWTYRRMPSLTTDQRLIVLHEDAPRQMLTRFPSEEEARIVVFADGRIELFSEQAFERLLVGDEVLRERLQMPSITEPTDD
ncbi:MAG: hypothetical protein HN712_27835 [Gemmatimonadetes bacterium]|nr:hypothetical protein [Gemmatimonadota bacterium]MBT7864154.1 hypothetical protein [Gemmatimonadota bacterium]